MGNHGSLSDHTITMGTNTSLDQLWFVHWLSDQL